MNFILKYLKLSLNYINKINILYILLFYFINNKKKLKASFYLIINFFSINLFFLLYSFLIIIFKILGYA